MDLLCTPEDRRSELQKNYFFFCDCTRCLNPIELVESNAAACPNSKCNEYLDARRSYDVCPKCNVRITDEHFERFFEVVELTKMHLDKMKDIACKSAVQLIYYSWILLFRFNSIFIFPYRFGRL